MGTGTGIGRVRGLGSAKSGAHHWWLQRVTAAGNLLLVTWFVISLFRLPNYDYGTVVLWLKSPLVAVPLILMAANVFWHLRIGLQVVIEDYVHGRWRLICLLGNVFFTVALGVAALYAILSLSFGA